MGRSGIIVTGLVAIALVIGGVVISKNKSNTDQTANTATTSITSPSTTSSQSSASTITYTSAGFSPSTTTIKKGDTITIINNSSDDIQFDSNPHPIHTDNSELNIDMVASGKSTSFTVSKVGTWGYHNHFNPSQTGTITVQ